jgi:hypothetical protein
MEPQRLEATRADPGSDLEAGALTSVSHHETGIDHLTLARLDIGLFRCLTNLGTSRERICAALCLSHAEYDHISKYIKAM